MGFQINLVSTFERINWIESKFKLDETIYMGDGIYDPLVFDKVGYSIAPQNAFINTKKYANFITLSKGGEGAVAEAVIHILENIFHEPFDILNYNLTSGSGAWTKSH